jgi:hypothetical protein
MIELEGPAATHGDEPRIPDLGEDHQFARLALGSAKGRAGSASDEPASLWSVGHHSSGKRDADKERGHSAAVRGRPNRRPSARDAAVTDGC